MSAPRVIDVHCECGHVFVPAEKMVPLSRFNNRPEVATHADMIFLAILDGQPMSKAEFICPDCGAVEHFSINDQRLTLLLDRVLTA